MEIMELIGEDTFNQMLVQTSIVSIFWVMTMFAVFIDLCMGIRASKSVGDFKTNSHGIRRTGRKLLEYWALMLMSLFVDFALLLFTMISDVAGIFMIFKIPIVTIIIFIVIIFTEFMSVKENIEVAKGKRIIPAKTVTLLADMVAKIGEGDNKINAKTVADVIRVVAGEKEMQEKEKNDGV